MFRLYAWGKFILSFGLFGSQLFLVLECASQYMDYLFQFLIMV